MGTVPSEILLLTNLSESYRFFLLSSDVSSHGSVAFALSESLSLNGNSLSGGFTCPDFIPSDACYEPDASVAPASDPSDSISTPLPTSTDQESSTGDSCNNAILLTIPPSGKNAASGSAGGSSASSSSIANDGQCRMVTPFTGAWYHIFGAGSLVTATACIQETMSVDTVLYVYKGACGSLRCVDHDTGYETCANRGDCVGVTWTALDGESYYIRVGGFNYIDYTLTLYDGFVTPAQNPTPTVPPSITPPPVPSPPSPSPTSRQTLPSTQTPLVSYPPIEPIDCKGDDLLIFEIDLDDHKEETTWELRSGGKAIQSGGPFEETTGWSTTQVCVTGSPFVSAVFDSAGDGLCCDSGIGAYRFTVNGKVLPTEVFTSGFAQTTPIILPLAEPLTCSDLLLIEFVFEGPSLSASWELTKDGVLLSSSEGPFEQGLSSTRIQKCLNAGKYIFKALDSNGNGFDGAYSLTYNGQAIPTHEFFDGSEVSTKFEI